MPDPARTPEPVRIKLYGLMSVTRRGYLTQLGFAFVLLVGLLAMWLLIPPLPGVQELEKDSPGLAWALPLLRNLPWIAGCLMILFGVEAMWVLRKFARAEAARKPV